jgi:hypothetical protein
MQLRQKLKAQTDEVTALQSKLGSLHADHEKEVSCAAQLCLGNQLIRFRKTH